MTEWLTENARRSYPLEHEWPVALADLWTPVLLDASIGFDGLPEDGRIRLLSVSKVGNAIAFRIGVSEDSYIDVPVTPGDGPRSLAYSYNPHYKAFLVLGNQALKAVLDRTADEWSANVDVPFALRCCSCATRFVSAVEAVAPENPCSRPVYGPGTRHTVKTAAGDVVLVSKDGLDIDVTQIAPLEGDLIRITAVTAPLQAKAVDKPVDMMIRGDECIQVESIPGVGVEDGALVPLSDPASGGVVRLTEKCKPCCQCEDYENAVKALKPGNDAATTLYAEFGDILDNATSGYRAALALLDEIKATASEKVNGYSHVIASGVAVASGGVTNGVMASGSRCRLALNVTVVNMTLSPVTVSNVQFSVSGDYAPAQVAWGSGTKNKVHWSTAGSRAASGTDLGRTWILRPGDTLSVVATYAKTGTTNTAYKPSDMSASFTASIPGLAPEPKTVAIK